MTAPALHQPVLLAEAIEGLAIRPEGFYVDGTFGRGGHSRAILQRLSPKGRLLVIDKDWEAIEHAQQSFAQEPRLEAVQGSFADLRQIAEQRGLVERIDGLLLDLGLSSPQIDQPERGFSFMHNGPLDMRMNSRQGLSAASFVNQASAAELAEVFRDYGEERFAGRIARAIVEARERARIETTAVLAELVKQANPTWEKHKHPATRVFQALRIHVNRELTDLSAGLQQSLEVLAGGGRLAVISFHSLEDRIVKQFMRAEEQGQQPPRGIPVRFAEISTRFRRVGKAIKAKDEEVRHNVRARSAVLRIGEKLA